MIAVALTAVAAVTHPAIQLAVPMLIGGEIAIADERNRLVWFGLVVAISFACALMRGERKAAPYVITIAALVLLRWIPIEDVMAGREIVLIAIAIGVVVLLRGTPFAIAVAVLSALFTPAVPLRTLAVPLVVLILAAIARASKVPVVRMRGVASVLLALPLFFFAWSGAFARTLPLMLRGPQFDARVHVGMALRPGESVEIDVPGNASSLVFSGANLRRLAPDTVLGRIAPGGTVIRMRDVADWGAFRREHYYDMRNRIPRDAAGLLRGYGQTAWFDGGGRVALSRGSSRITVTADRTLPAQARLQIDAFELRSR